MKIEVIINNCGECRYKDHSGCFTPGGAKPICSHSCASDIAGKGKRNKYDWKYRVLNKKLDIPNWCPLKNGFKY